MSKLFTLWSWGANSHGQLGLNEISEQVNAPTKITTDCWSKTKQVACGGGHTLLLDDEGKLFACGWNVKKQLGLEDDAQCFERVWSLSGIKFTRIACGWDFSCGVTDDRYLFVWGSNSHGQLGLPKHQFSDTIKSVRLQVNACSVSMGLRHTAIINSKGEVWSTGCGKHGQLGLGASILMSDRFQKVPLKSKVTHLACGQNFTLAWSSDERVLYVWGDNRYGQLLLPSEKYKKIYKPEKIDIDEKRKVNKLLCGWTNALIWLEDGELLVWGRNSYGQLGTNEAFEGKIYHIRLPENRQVKDIALGSEHTVCLSTDNTLWAWGWNEHGNTGTASGDNVFAPIQISFEHGIYNKITNIYAGSAHNFMAIEECKKDGN